MGTFGLLVGISLLLQGMNQFILSGVGYDDLSSGEGNTLYQLLAALVGVGLGSRVTCEADLRTVQLAVDSCYGLYGAAPRALRVA